MTQPGLLFDLPASRPRKRGQVTRTSVEAGRAVNRDGRVEKALNWLEAYRRSVNLWPTSAELAQAVYEWGTAGTNAWFRRAPMELVLHVRRGLSDALSAGFAEHAGERTCAVSGRTCVVWKLRTR